MLGKLGLYASCASTASLAEAVETFVEVERIKTFVHNVFTHLPHWFQEANPSVVPSPLGDEDNYDP